MKRLLLSIMGLVLLSVSVYAQNYVVKGRVIDAEVLDALPGAQIVVTGTQRGTVTDANGRFEIELGANENQLTVSFLGYETRNVNVNRDGRDLIIRLNPSALGLQEIRVVGFQTERSLQQTAASVSVISPRDIARHNAVTLQPILNTIPGVRIDQAGLENQRVTIRGIGTNSNAGVRGIKIYLNEIPFTEPDGFSRMEAIDFAAVGRVEVIRGPGSSIYGAANGGVLNLTTQRAEYDDTSLTMSSLLGSYGLSRNNVIFKSGTDRSNIFVSYNTQSWDGFRDWNSSDRKSMNFIGQFFVGDKMTVNTLFSYLDDQNQNPNSLTREQMEENPRQEALIAGVPGQPSERRASYWNNRREQDWVRFGTSVKYNFTDELSATGSVFGGFYDQVFTVPNVNIVQAEAQSYGSRALLNYRPKIENLGLVFQGGLEYQKMRQPGNNRAFNAAGDPAQLQLLSTNIFENMTYFLQAEVELSPKTIFTAGFSTNTFTYGRVDYLGGNSIILPPTATSLPAGTTAGLNGSSERKFDTVFTPRVALNHIFSDALAARISYSTGFTPPIGNEAFTTIDGRTVFNPNLNAAESRQVELGIRGTLLDRRFNYDLAWYQLNIDNELVTETVNFAPTARNAGETKRVGIELSASYNLITPEDGNAIFSSIRPWLSYTNQNFTYVSYTKQTVFSAAPAPPFLGIGTLTEVFDGNRLPGNADNLLNIGLDFETKVGLYLNATYFFVDEIPLWDGNGPLQVRNTLTGNPWNLSFAPPFIGSPLPLIQNTFQDAYSLINLKFGYRRTTGRVSFDIYGGVDNLTDTQYSGFIQVNDAQGRFFRPAMGVNYYAGVNLGIRLN